MPSQVSLENTPSGREGSQKKVLNPSPLLPQIFPFHLHSSQENPALQCGTSDLVKDHTRRTSFIQKTLTLIRAQHNPLRVRHSFPLCDPITNHVSGVVYSNQSGLGFVVLPRRRQKESIPTARQRTLRTHLQGCGAGSPFGGQSKSGGDSTNSKVILLRGGTGLVKALLCPRDGAEASVELLAKYQCI